ncbi:acyltransferase family protein [Cellulomonas wangsupingiae]|uniref:Acyltransferase n=1 Tax=Cellulomonas wangsupingiae TaxID=2968085 RepID=A0ABY5K6H9_9CELL|nr:acyltransferase [Cellulomonas wangsupingiae]MCC2336356.1 acyltransferase [Cellulomonas wangsupingiae]UUI65668.1 acyltransferase [Cellulomonas wangsupingiae]
MTARVGAWDALRGVAIGLVMLRHAWPDVFPGAGVVGVVMFFALSGHLITGLLVDEAAATGRVDLRRFWLRRARRLVPALLVLVVGFVLVTLTLDPLGDSGTLPRTVAVSLTYTANLPYVGLVGVSPAIYHLWTLATEEQFYLLWPLVIVLAARARRLRTGLVLAGAASAALCVLTVVWFRDDPDAAYPLATSWIGCFVIGAASRVTQDRWTAAWRGRHAVVAAVTLLAALTVADLRGHAATYLLAGPAVAVATVVLMQAWRGHVTPAPAWRPLVALGTVSYAAYLWNYPLTLWLRPALGDTAGLVVLPATVLVATASWWLVERPVQRHGRAAGSGTASAPPVEEALRSAPGS